MFKKVVDITNTSWYVHFMNAERPSPSGADHLKSLQILDELSNNDSLTQRDLSSRLGIALGLVNSYIKNLVAKGYITVKNIPPKRYAYYLTPKGFTEKTRLTYDLLHDYTRVYREARSNLKRLFQDLEASGVKKIVFAGADEIAEIAYISLKETTLELVNVVDDDMSGQNFFGNQVQPVQSVQEMRYDAIVVTSYLKRKQLHTRLVTLDVNKESIHTFVV